MAKRGRPKKNNDELKNNVNEESTKPKRKYVKKNKNVEQDNQVDENEKSQLEEQKNVNPYTDINYVQSLKYDWVHPSKILLNKANSELHKSYKSWDELSADGNLSEDFISKYQNEINWYFLLKKQKDFSEKFIKKFKDHFILLRLGLV